MSAGAQAGKGIADASRDVDVVITMLPNSAIVLEAVAGPAGILAHARAKTIVMDMSTVAPEVTDQLSMAATAKGMSFVDAPVGRLASHADKGESLFMVGASEADFERVKPLLEAMGTTLLITAARQGRAPAPSWSTTTWPSSRATSTPRR